MHSRIPPLYFIPKCSHTDSPPGPTGSWLRPQASWREPVPEPLFPGGSSCWVLGGAGIRQPGTWEPGPAQRPSFLAAWLPLANSCLCAAPLRRICAPIHHRPPLGKAKKVALYEVKLMFVSAKTPAFPLPPASSASPPLFLHPLWWVFNSVCFFFFLSPFFLGKTGLSLWVEKGSVFVECSCISKVLCWPVMNLPLLMWGNREILWLFFPPKLKLMLFLCQWYPRICFVSFPPLSD